jgi:hypothetical protein
VHLIKRPCYKLLRCLRVELVNNCGEFAQLSYGVRVFHKRGSAGRALLAVRLE